MRIMITGDFVINQDYEKSKISPELLDLFEQSDFNIVNLEAPVTNANSKILKTGPHLKSNSSSTLNILKNLNVEILTLANNHILDFDEKGVVDTLGFCNSNFFQYVGAGMNLEEASQTLYLNTAEGRIAIINFAENEWASATELTAGANPMDVIDNAEQIKLAKQKADYVFVIVHGGHEYYNLPSPLMQKQYRFYAEQGADIVVGHHTHCINGNEIYKGIPIYYSLGNFLFTKESLYEDWYLGLLLEITIENGKLTPRLHPVKQEKETFSLSLLNNTEKERVLERIAGFNSIIADFKKLKQHWESYVEANYKSYLNYWSPISFVNNRYINALLRKFGMTGINRKGMALALNLMRCEAHAVMSKEVIRKYLLK